MGVTHHHQLSHPFLRVTITATQRCFELSRSSRNGQGIGQIRFLCDWTGWCSSLLLQQLFCLLNWPLLTVTVVTTCPPPSGKGRLNNLMPVRKLRRCLYRCQLTMSQVPSPRRHFSKITDRFFSMHDMFSKVTDQPTFWLQSQVASSALHARGKLSLFSSPEMSKYQSLFRHTTRMTKTLWCRQGNSVSIGFECTNERNAVRMPVTLCYE